MSTKIKIALDWTPNVNHIGFFVAKALGYYEEQGLSVELNSPSDDNYTVTPAKKVELGIADFALCPMESVLSYRTKKDSFRLKAVAAIYQEDLSAVATLTSSGINRPKDLDDKIYASYKARYEDEIVKQMIRNDGGKGQLKLSYPDKLGIWETLLKGNADATWIFLNWEGIQAKGEGIELHTFKMNDFGIPYSYSPVIAAPEASIEGKVDAFKRFLKATKHGFLEAKKNPKNAASILAKWIPSSDQNIDLEEAINASSPYFGTETSWGQMKQGEVQKYLQWIYKYGMEQQHLAVDELITNELIS